MKRQIWILVILVLVIVAGLVFFNTQQPINTQSLINMQSPIDMQPSLDCEKKSFLNSGIIKSVLASKPLTPPRPPQLPHKLTLTIPGVSNEPYTPLYSVDLGETIMIEVSILPCWDTETAELNISFPLGILQGVNEYPMRISLKKNRTYSHSFKIRIPDETKYLSSIVSVVLTESLQQYTLDGSEILVSRGNNPPPGAELLQPYTFATSAFLEFLMPSNDPNGIRTETVE